MKARKKPVEIEYMVWDGESHREMFNFLGGDNKKPISVENDNFYIDHSKVEGGLVIKTSEGDMTASKGDCIIKEPFDKERRFYPCKPDIFLQTYDIIG